MNPLIRIDQPLLRRALEITGKAAQKGSFLPGAGLVQVATTDGLLSLACFDGEMVAAVQLPVAVKNTDGINPVYLPAATFKDLIATLSGEVTIEFTAQEAVISSGKHQQARLRIEADGAPIPALRSNTSVAEGNAGLPLRGQALQDLAFLTRFASKDDVRPSLACVHLTFLNEKDSLLHAEAADGYRLGRLNVEIAGPVKDVAPFEALAPAAAIRAIGSVARPEDTAFVSLAQDRANSLVISLDQDGQQIAFGVLLVASQYPDTQQVLDAARERRAVTLRVSSPQLETVLRRVAAVGSDAVFLKAINRNGDLRLLTCSHESGAASGVNQEQLQAADATGAEEAHAWIQSALIKPALSWGDELILSFGPEIKDALMLKSGQNGRDLEVAVMPLHNDKDPFEGNIPAPALFSAAVPENA